MQGLLPLAGEKLMHLFVPPVLSPTWVKALKGCTLITPRAGSYFGIKTKTKQQASDSSCLTRATPEAPDVWKYASAAASSTEGEIQTASSTVECYRGRKIAASVNFLKILAFELPGIPQEMWVSSSKPANLVNWYCGNQQRVWLAHKTTGEISCRDSLAMQSVLGHGSSHRHSIEFPCLWGKNYTMPDLNLYYLTQTTSWSHTSQLLFHQLHGTAGTRGHQLHGLLGASPRTGKGARSVLE